MKLIACLTILSSILAFSSTGLANPRASAVPESHIVPEQLQRDYSPIPPWWSWDMWGERVFPPRRRRRRRRWRRWRKHKPGRLERLLRRFRRWRRQRRRLRRQWQELMDGTAPEQPTVCGAEEAYATTAPCGAVQETLETQATKAGGVGEAYPATRRGPGRPRTIPTSHRCCPNEGCLAYGRLGDDPLHDIVGCGTYATTHGEMRQMYQCNVCGKPFSETAGTPFFGLKTPMKTVCIALQELAEGLGIRAVARIHGVKPDTVCLGRDTSPQAVGCAAVMGSSSYSVTHFNQPSQIDASTEAGVDAQPSAPARSVIVSSPHPWCPSGAFSCAGSNPSPSSAMANRTTSSPAANFTSTWEAWACFATLVNASWAMRNSAFSAGSGSRGAGSSPWVIPVHEASGAPGGEIGCRGLSTPLRPAAPARGRTVRSSSVEGCG